MEPGTATGWSGFWWMGGHRKARWGQEGGKRMSGLGRKKAVVRKREIRCWRVGGDSHPAWGGCQCVVCSALHDPMSKGRTLNSTNIKMCGRLMFQVIYFFKFSLAKIGILHSSFFNYLILSCIKTHTHTSPSKKKQQKKTKKAQTKFTSEKNWHSPL